MLCRLIYCKFTSCTPPNVSQASLLDPKPRGEVFREERKENLLLPLVMVFGFGADGPVGYLQGCVRALLG